MLKLSLIVRGTICLLLVFLPLYSLDQWFYDQFFRLRGTRHKPNPIILIEVSDTKLFSLMNKNNVPYSREDTLFEPRTHSVWYLPFYEKLVGNILTGSPKLTVFTSFFHWLDQKSSPVFDQSNVLFSSAINEYKQLVFPNPVLTKNSNFGYANIFPDQDNVVRQSKLLDDSGASLALRVFHRLIDQPIKRNLHESLKIDFKGPQHSYITVDAWEIFEDKLSPDFFKDKIVLIGKELSPTSEFDTPFNKMSALEIQANTIDTFLHETEIISLPRWVSWILAAIAVISSIAIILLFPLTLAWLFLLLFSMVLILITLFMFSQFKIWWGIGNPLFCVFGTHLLMLGYKLSRQEEQQWKIQQEANSLKEIDQFKNNFISLFSHDLKTPISKIKAISERIIASHENLDSEILESLKNILKTNNELSRLISDILKVTKMESMSPELKREVLDLNRMIELSVQRLSFLSEEKGVEIILDLEPLFSMEGDSELIQEVFTNLLENAIKYSHPKGRVIVQTSEDETFVKVVVKDEGEGIPADEIPRVAGKFYRGRKTLNKTKGSGLGLYLVKYFVELHHGTLDIKSELGKGTTVTFTLPFNHVST